MTSELIQARVLPGPADASGFTAAGAGGWRAFDEQALSVSAVLNEASAGSSIPSATVEIHGANIDRGVVSAGTRVVTLYLSGYEDTAASPISEEMRCFRFYMAKVTAIAGTGATCQVVVGV